jgi:hypothetical protein
VDSIPAHKTNFFSEGSHFRFFYYGKGSSPSVKEVIEYVKRVCLRDDVDFLIDVLGETDISKGLVRDAVGVMQMQESGLMASVFSGESKDNTRDIPTKEVVRRFHFEVHRHDAQLNPLI